MDPDEDPPLAAHGLVEVVPVVVLAAGDLPVELAQPLVRGGEVDDLDAALEKAAAHGCHPLRGAADYQGVYRLTYLRGPSGIVVMLAQDMRGD